MRWRRAGLASILLVLSARAFGACSSDARVGQNTAGTGGTSADAGPDTGSSTDAAADADDLDALIEKWVDGVCAAIAPCCVQDQLIGDEAHCRASLQGLIASFGIGLDPSRDRATVAKCVEEAIALATQCDPAFVNPPSCSPVGTKLPGSACEDDDECATPAVGTAHCEDSDVGPNPKVCKQRIPGKAGDPCVWTCVNPDFTTCFSGVASQANIEVTCLVSDGLTCTGTCTPFDALGEPCQSFSCGPDAFCNAQAVCEAKRPLGATCPEFAFGIEQSCAEGSYCEGAQSGVTHSGTCAPMSEIGDPCSTDAQCKGDNCHQGTCHPPFKFGPIYCK